MGLLDAGKNLAKRAKNALGNVVSIPGKILKQGAAKTLSEQVETTRAQVTGAVDDVSTGFKTAGEDIR